MIEGSGIGGHTGFRSRERRTGDALPQTGIEMDVRGGKALRPAHIRAEVWSNNQGFCGQCSNACSVASVPG